MDPSLTGIPLGVVQYNPYGNLADLPVEANRRMDHSNGSLIAVSYEVGVCVCVRDPKGIDTTTYWRLAGFHVVENSKHPHAKSPHRRAPGA